MTKKQAYNIDSIIKSHASIISDANSLNSKIIYSITCLQNNIEYQNSNRNANIMYLQPSIRHIISLGERVKDITEDHLKVMLRLINTLLSQTNTLSAAQAVSLISIIVKINTNHDVMGEDLCHEIVSLCSKLKNQGESSKLLLQLMATKMSPEQSIILIDSFRKNQLYITEVYQLICLGTHYNKNQEILRRVFQGLHWQVMNVLSQRKDTAKESKEIINFIKLTLTNNINNIKIVTLCALVYRDLTDSFKMLDRNTISKNLDYFLRTNGLLSTSKPYLVQPDRLISSFTDLSTILELEISVEQNKHLHYLLYYYSANPFTWREELLSSLTNGKGTAAKELLLRSTQHYSVQPRSIKCITQKDQIVYSNFLPIECLRSLPSILNKLHKEPTPHNALQTIGFFHSLPKNHPQFKDILLLLLEIYLKNREFQSLQQVERLIKDEISGDEVVKKLKEKGTIKDRDSNKQSKRYFIFIPLVCTRAETQSVSQELSSIFIHQTVHIALKLYVADFVLTKMILNPAKTFMLFLLRYVQSSFSPNLLKLFLIYLQPHSVDHNPAVSEWYSKHFSQITQKLLQFVFSKLIIREISQTSKLVFLLQKFNVFGQNWINSYRWVLNSLQEINEIYSDHTVDCLQIFQMIIQKITISKIPQAAIQRFQKIVLKNWTKYTQEHLYAIQRIVALLNEHSYLGFKEVALPPLQKISKDGSDYLTTYISNVTFNLFFNHIDIDKAFQSLLTVCDTHKDSINQHAALAALNLLLFLFQGSEEAVSPKADDFVLQIVSKFKNTFAVQGKCLQYLSRVPHNINILKIPLLSLSMQGFYNTIWITDLTQLLNIVTELKPKAIGSYKLQQVIKSMMVYLIASENRLLVDSLMDYLEGTCFIQGDYQQTLDTCLPALENVIKAERCGVDYRKNLVQFVLGTLLDYQYELNQDCLWFLMSKYASEAEIILLILEYFQKFTIKDQLLHEKLLMRVVLIHTQNEKIQQKCKTIFKLHAPKSSQEQQLIDHFSKSNFSKCEQLIAQVNNPYALNFSLGDIRSLLEWKNAAQNCKKLIRFLYNHPQNQPKFYSCESFILNPQYISYLGQVVDKIDGEILVEKFNNNFKKQFLSIKKHPSLQILQKTVIEMMKNKQTVLKIKNLFHESFKNREDDFAILLKLFVLIFSRLKKDKRNNDELKSYSKFFTEIVGELQLKDRQKSNKFITKNLVYIFPFFINNTQITDPLTYYSSLLAHYRSVLISFTAIQKEISSSRYFILLSRSLLESSKNCENKGLFIEQYLKTHLLLEGNEQLALKQNDMQKYKLILIQILQLVNKIAQTKTRENSAKLQYPFLNGYVAHLIFLINQGINLDIATLQIVNSIILNLDALVSAEDYKTTIKQALQWISKHIEKNMPIAKNQQKLASSSPSKEPNYASSKPKEQEYASSKTIGDKNSPENSQKEYQTKSKTQAQQQKSYQTSKKNEQPRNIQAQQQQAYIKYRQIEQKTTITQTKTTNKTTIVVLNQNQASTSSLFNEEIQKPKEETFNQDKFYKGIPQTQPSNPSQNQRQVNLDKVTKIVSGENSISSLKDHCKFISSLALLITISQPEFAQLLTSIESITQTVSSHTFYVRKVVEYETSIKLVRVYKTMWRSNGKKNCEILVMQMLKLFLSMSKMKERKQIIFSEEETVQFFKMVVKRRLNTQGQIKEMQFLIEILYNCRNNNEIFFSLGLISMLVQIINRDKDAFLILVLEYFIKIDLTPQIINEIYQRGSFNTLVQTFSSSLSTDLAKKILSLWIRLAGKVCINQSIQQKFRSTNLHLLVWGKIPILTAAAQRKDIAYFFAYLCLKNQSITQWMIQSKVPQQILSNLGELTDNEELYLLFYHFCFGNNINRDYCFRIKYHVHLLNRLNLRYNELKENQETIHLNKYFYKSLGQLMNSPMHLSTFFKEEVVRKLIEIYNVKCEPCIFQALLDFISALQSEAQFDQLKRQNFWDSLKIFEFKISSEATYSYLLQIFLIMIKKGRTKQFSTAELRNKVCLKAEFSINMQGKQLALRFLLALSIKDKQNYLNQRSIGLLASVLGFKVSRNELQLAYDILKVEGASKNEEFLGYFLNKDNNIHSLIAQNAQKLTQQQLRIAINILLIISTSPSSKKQIADICLPTIKRLLQKSPKQHFALIIQLLSSLSINPSNKDTFEFLQIDKAFASQASSNAAKEQDCLNEYNQLCKNIQKMKGITTTKPNNQQQIKKAVTSLRQGKKVKMYKTDGSISDLLLFISFDCLELNCAVTLSEVVKQKWRLPLNEITKIVEYVGQESNQFQNSYFEKNSGFFTKAPNCEQCLSLLGKNNEFHICFSAGEKQQWKLNFQIVREYARNLLSKVSNK